jgi:uncharacterized protein YlxP (DUF503 family)
MIIGVMTANLHLHGIGSLKEKRSIVKSVIGRLQSRFNVSISEVDHNDSKLIATIGVASSAMTILLSKASSKPSQPLCVTTAGSTSEQSNAKPSAFDWARHF